MIPHNSSLSSSRQIQFILKNGRRFHSKYITLTLIATRPEKKEQPRVLITIPKKIAKKANKRNFMRRRLASLYLKNKIQFGNHHAVFLPKSPTFILPFTEVKNDFETLLPQVQRSLQYKK